MRLWSIRNTKISCDGEAIGISFGYGPLRDPRVYPVNTIDLIPTASAKVTASDEFYAKFHFKISSKVSSL